MIDKIKSLGIRNVLRIAVVIIGLWYLANGIYGLMTSQ
jgi:hypothetical protein